MCIVSLGNEHIGNVIHQYPEQTNTYAQPSIFYFSVWFIFFVPQSWGVHQMQMEKTFSSKLPYNKERNYLTLHHRGRSSLPCKDQFGLGPGNGIGFIQTVPGLSGSVPLWVVSSLLCGHWAALLSSRIDTGWDGPRTSVKRRGEK